MKFLLVPITSIAWYTIIHLLFWLSFNATVFIVNQSWIVIFFTFLFMLGIITFITTSLPNLIGEGIRLLYKNNKAVNVIHAIFGIIAVIWFLVNLSNDQPRFIVYDNWERNKVKILVLLFPLSGMFLGLVYASVSMLFNKKNYN